MVAKAQFMASRRHTNAEESSHQFFRLDTFPIDMYCPALVVGDARKEQRRFIRFQCGIDASVTVATHNHLPPHHLLSQCGKCLIVKAVYNDLRCYLVIGNLRKVDGLTGRSVTEFHHIAPL